MEEKKSSKYSIFDELKASRQKALEKGNLAFNRHKIYIL